jgi:hypothetical protein
MDLVLLDHVLQHLRPVVIRAHEQSIVMVNEHGDVASACMPCVRWVGDEHGVRNCSTLIFAHLCLLAMSLCRTNYLFRLGTVCCIG